MDRSTGIYKIASLLIAVALAVYVNGERNPIETRTCTVPLSAQNTSPETLVKTMPQAVTVEVTGPRNSVLLVSARDISATLNLGGRRPGAQQVRVIAGAARGATIPPEVTVTPLEPTATVVLEPVTRQSRPLEPVFLRPAPSGFSYGLPSVQPPVANVSGPEGAVSRVDRLQVLVDALPVPGSPVSGRFPVQAVDKTGKVISEVKPKPPFAMVRCEVQSMPAEKEILVSPNVTGSPAPGFRVTGIQVVPQSVVVTGDPTTLSRLNFVSTQEIDITNSTSSQVRSTPLLLPAGVTTQSSRRARVDITVSPRG